MFPIGKVYFDGVPPVEKLGILGFLAFTLPGNESKKNQGTTFDFP